MIYFIILFVLFLIYKFLNAPLTYFQDIGEDINKFLILLLYRGKIKNDIVDSGTVFISKRINEEKNILLFLKYKIKGKIGVYLYVPLYKDYPNLKEKIENYLKENNIKFFFDKYYKDDLADEFVVIDIKQDVKIGNKIYKKIFKDFFEIEEHISISCFKMNSTNKLDTCIDFNYDKTNIDLPIKNYEEMLREFKKKYLWK